MLARILAAFISAVLFVSALAGCAAMEPADCRTADLATYADAMTQQITTFRQQSELVGAAPRASIGAPLQRLLDIQTETRAIEAPGCVVDHQARTVAAMEQAQTAFQGFASQQMADGLVGYTLGEAAKQLEAVEADLVLIAGGTVPPTPTPAPTPEAISPAERGIVGKTELLLFAPGANAQGMFEVCEGDFFELFARSGEYVQVRITALGNGTRCSGILPHATVGLEGWLRDDAVFAPDPTPTPAPPVETLSTPEPATAREPGAKLAATSGGERRGLGLCAGDQVEILARQEFEGAQWAQVRLVARADSCPYRAGAGQEGWLLASEVE